MTSWCGSVQRGWSLCAASLICRWPWYSTGMHSLQRLVLGLVMLGATVAAHAAETFDLPSSRPGVTQPIYLHSAAHPAASAVLFPGGSGAVYAVRKNFLIRTADDFAALGITVAIADTPSDHPGGADRAFRASEAQAVDTAAVVAFLRLRASVPVWLIGTSNGAISAANAGVRLGPSRIAGVVLTSSVWTGGMQATDFQMLRVPTLIVHNRNDGCLLSPFDQAAPALASMQNAPAKELIAVSSSASLSGACDAMSPHGYLGIEKQVVQRIANWIKTH
jgi:predicted esterase